jgi:hypothetical protein
VGRTVVTTSFLPEMVKGVSKASAPPTPSLPQSAPRVRNHIPRLRKRSLAMAQNSAAQRYDPYAQRNYSQDTYNRDTHQLIKAREPWCCLAHACQIVDRKCQWILIWINLLRSCAPLHLAQP